MDLINQLLQIAYFIIGFLIILMVSGIVFFFIRKKKRKPQINDYSSVDYSGLSRRDSKDYIKIDDIIDNVIITDNWTRFIGVIDCAGFDFYAMSVQEQANVVKNYMSFINTLDGPITYRQYSCSADMEDALLRYNKALQSVDRLANDVFLQIDELYRSYSDFLSADDLLLYDSRMAELKRLLDVYEFRRIHILDQIKYIHEYSGNNVAPLLTQTYVFEWDSSSLEASDLMTRDEIFAKAKVELDSIAFSKIHALNVSGVKGRRCTTEELIDMFRRHSQPVSSERFKKKDLRNDDFGADIVTSDSLNEYQEKVYDFRMKVLGSQDQSLISNIISNTISLMSSEKEKDSTSADINAVSNAAKTVF